MRSIKRGELVPPAEVNETEDQFDLPLTEFGNSRNAMGRAPEGRRTPQSLLAEYLHPVGVDDPMRLAGALLRDFGSLCGVLSASWWALRNSAGHRVAYAIRSSREVMKAALVEEVAQGPVVSSRSEVVRLIQLHLGSLRRERLIALYLDPQLHLLRIQRISDGTISDTSLEAARIIHGALEVAAAGILLVHNHPSGDPTPSQADIRATARLARIATDLDMHLVDHLILGSGEVTSVLALTQQRSTPS